MLGVVFARDDRNIQGDGPATALIGALPPTVAGKPLYAFLPILVDVIRTLASAFRTKNFENDSPNVAPVFPGAVSKWKALSKEMPSERTKPTGGVQLDFRCAVIRGRGWRHLRLRRNSRDSAGPLRRVEDQTYVARRSFAYAVSTYFKTDFYSAEFRQSDRR